MKGLLAEVIERMVRWFVGLFSGGSPSKPGKPDEGDYREQLLVAHNQERKNVPQLEPNSKLDQAALKHAMWMAENNNMTHLNNLSERVRDTGYSYVSIGENIAMGYASVGAVMRGWMSSAGHRRNILRSSYRDVGFGKVILNGRAWWCTIFGRSRDHNNADIDISVYCAGGLTDPLVAADDAVERSVKRKTPKKKPKKKAGK